jgi:hypothetical protein
MHAIDPSIHISGYVRPFMLVPPLFLVELIIVISVVSVIVWNLDLTDVLHVVHPEHPAEVVL